MSKDSWFDSLPVRYVSPWPKRIAILLIVGAVLGFLFTR